VLKSGIRFKPGILGKKSDTWKSVEKKRQAISVKDRLIHRPTRLIVRVGNLKAIHDASGGKTSGPNRKRTMYATAVNAE
jgi:hypothetical protein